ncbi:venom dipeptidyl peptidase 4-like [Ostrinia nubilalis]|uniref:venom dipeptidyl peptidase 4-like n=1 Tax=Ostrinia nubilalis TaxID=29057 RepID=UPI0030822D8A
MEARSVQFLLMAAILCCQTESSPFPQRVLKAFTLEEVVPLRDFYPDRLSVQWISDSEYIRREPGVGMLKFNALSQTITTILTESELYNLNEYVLSSFSENGKFVLLASNKTKVYRYSSIADYSVYDLENKSIYKIGQGPLQVAIWSSNGGLAYVYNNNVFYLPDASSPESVTQLTTQGVPGEVYFGATDWIYEEEVFNAAEAMWFSPSGTYLAIASFNDTFVESAIYPYYGNASDINNQYPELVEFKYPKAGRVNPKVGLRVVKLDDPTIEPWIIPAPVDVVGIDHILGRVNWASDQNLVVLWLNRRQSTSILVNCDLKQDKCSMVNEHTEHNGWVDITQPFFDRTGTKMVEIQPLYHEDQRFPHAARFDFNTLTTEDLSPGNSTVTEILGWDQDTDTVYYIVAPGSIPWQRQLWATTRGVVRCISCKEPSCHYTSAMFSLGGSFGVVSCSSSNVPPKIFLYICNGDRFLLLKDNAQLAHKLSQYKLPLTLFNVLPLGEDVTSHVKLLLPADMQKDVQYPMILRVYAGPGTTRVKDNYDLEFYNMYLSSNRSFIVASIDVRGSGVMGVEAMHAVNTALGTVEVTDTLAAIRRLVDLYPFIDPKRIGVWGWSYGGFVTTMMLIQDDQKLLACGAAVAPVTSWLYYDSIYTERYMDIPRSNPLGYQRSDVTAMAEKLRGRRFLLVHGTGDDNVHYQHSMQLAKQLQHADIAFEQMSYTDENHSLLGVSRHFYHTLDHFWTECFHP